MQHETGRFRLTLAVHEASDRGSTNVLRNIATGLRDVYSAVLETENRPHIVQRMMIPKRASLYQQLSSTPPDLLVSVSEEIDSPDIIDDTRRYVAGTLSPVVLLSQKSLEPDQVAHIYEHLNAKLVLPGAAEKHPLQVQQLVLLDDLPSFSGRFAEGNPQNFVINNVQRTLQLADQTNRLLQYWGLQN